MSIFTSVSRLGMGLLSLGLFTLSVSAQVTYQLADINPTTTGAYNYLIEPKLAIDYNGMTFFSFNDGVHGEEIWQTDGTVAGTHLAVDVIPGNDSNSPKFLVAFNGLLYVFGNEIYRSAGTQATNEHFADHFAIDPKVIGSYLYWRVNNTLWRTDGTVAGTIELSDDVRNYTELGGQVIALNLSEVIISDGTLAGTTTIANASSTLKVPVVLGNHLYFPARNESNQWAIWRSDGTTLGTDVFMDIPNVGNTTPDNFCVANNQFFFRVDQTTLWRSDGTTKGTDPLDLPSGYYYSTALGTVGDSLIFMTRDASFVQEVWSSDGTPENTISLGALSTFGPSIVRYSLGEHDGHYYFLGYNNRIDYLLKTDGTTLELVRTWDTNPFGSLSESKQASISERTTFSRNGLLFFPIFDGIHGTEWWTTDGTEANTQLFADLANEENGSQGLDNPSEVLPLGNRIIFRALGDPYSQLWSTDGSSQGTEQLSSFTTSMVAVDGTLYYNDLENSKVWRSDGTAAGAHQLSNHYAGNFHQHAGEPRFVSSNAIWKITGTDEVIRVKPSFTGSESITSPITSQGDHYYLLSYDFGANASDYTLWRVTDATGEALHQWPQISNYPKRIIVPLGDGVLVSMNNELWFADSDSFERLDAGNLTWVGTPISYAGKYFFPAETEEHGIELWCSDGTIAGTVRVTDFNPGAGDGLAFFTGMYEYNGLLYFYGHDGTREHILRSDGTAAGTMSFTDLYPPSYAGEIRAFVEIDGLLYFPAYTDTSNFELWRSDGTEVGTTQLAELADGIRSSVPSQLWSLDDQLFFVADTGSGHEPQIYRDQPSERIHTRTSVCDTSTTLTATAHEDHPDTTYTWNLTGGTIQSGQGTQTITFTHTGPTVELSVDLDVNGLTATANETVTILSAVPAPPAAINGNTTYCPDEMGQTYAIDSPVAGLSYQWRVPTGAVITNGQGTSEITVDFGTFGGEIAVAAVNACGASTETSLSVNPNDAPRANAGPSQVVCDASTNLAGNSSSEVTGTWTIISGEGGTLSDPNDPTTLFTGTPGETYILEWMLDHPACGVDSDRTTIAFAPPTDTAAAGPDQTVCASSTLLAANSSETGYGVWERVSGEGGSFENIYDPQTRFFGAADTVYVLRWILRSKPCPETTDEVTLTFLPRPAIDAGEDRIMRVSSSLSLNADPEGGTWSVVSGPELSTDQFDDVDASNATFQPAGGVGTYRLRWTVPRTGCDPLIDELDVVVTTPNTLPQSAGSLQDDTVEREVSPNPGIYWQDWYYFSGNGFYGGELWRTNGETVELVSDIIGGTSNSRPFDFIPLDDVLVFTAINEDVELTLWATDGQGATQLNDTCFGAVFPVRVGNQIYYRCSNQLWVTDGTRTGTRVVSPYSITPKIEYQGKLVFSLNGHLWIGEGGEEDTYLGAIDSGSIALFQDQLYLISGGSLWRSDGTAEGTVTVGAFNFNFSNTSEMLVFKDHLFFTASVGSDEELWRTDGTEGGTFMLTNINPLGSSSPTYLTAGEQSLYFAARDHEGDGLWMTDGSTANTRKLYSGHVSYIYTRGDTAYYRGTNEIPRLRKANSAGDEVIRDFPNGVTVLGWDLDSLLLGAQVDGSNASYLWLSDGTTEGTVPWTQVGYASASSYGLSFTWNDTLFFTHTDETHGYEVWINDTEGPRLLDDLVPGVDSPGFIESYATFEDEVFWVTGQNTSARLWRSDGTAEGTSLVIDASSSTFYLGDLIAMGDQLYFVQDTGSGRQLYRMTRGEGAPTVLDNGNLTNVRYPTVWRDKLYIIGTSDSRQGLHQSDGTNAGTVPSSIYTETLYNWTPWPAQSRLYFKINTGFYVAEVDEQAQPIPNAPLTHGALMGERLLIYGKYQNSFDRVIISDGTNRSILFDFVGSSFDNLQVATSSEQALIVGKRADGGHSAWTTDGTVAGTFEHRFDTGNIYPWLENPINLGDRFFLTVHDPNLGSELWELDATHHWPLLESEPGPLWYYTEALANDGQTLWLQHGTAGGRRFSVIHNETLSFLDRNLMTALLERYDLNDDDLFDTFEAAITELDLRDANIYYLDGIEQFPNLQRLLLSGNQLTDVTPLLASQLGSQATDHLDISGNFLEADDCTVIGQLLTRAQSSGATVIYADQGGERYYPPPPQWPAASIVDMLGGNEIPPDQLDCQPSERLGRTQTAGGAR